MKTIFRFKSNYNTYTVNETGTTKDGYTKMTITNDYDKEIMRAESKIQGTKIVFKFYTLKTTMAALEEISISFEYAAEVKNESIYRTFIDGFNSAKKRESKLFA